MTHPMSVHELRGGATKLLCILAIAAVTFVANARDTQASVLDLGHPTLSSYFSTSVGNTDRSVVFDALSDFSISSAGIRFDPLAGGATTVQVEIWDMNLSGGIGTLNSLLATGSISITDSGMAFYDVPVDFNFNGGTRYNIAFNSAASTNWGFGLNNMEFYNFNYPDTPFAVGGLVNVLDGGADGASGFGNTVMPHIRLNTGSNNAVPEPGTMAIWTVIGMAAVGFFRNRGKKRIIAGL